ncbi:MAG: DM13 domain-containing protein [Pseudomonadota bacterium]
MTIFNIHASTAPTTTANAPRDPSPVTQRLVAKSQSRINIMRKAGPLASALVALGLMFAATDLASAGEVLKTGKFFGQSQHVTSGTVTLERDGDRVLVVLGKDFSLDGAPTPTLGFSNGKKFDVKTQFAKLKRLKGRQVYVLPKGIKASAYNTFTVWCSRFSIPLGSARLS